jgi:allantoicase
MAQSTLVATFNGLVDLASAALGGEALSTNDEFFAGKENLLQPGRGVFKDGLYTDRGKWMDGWESRRKRGPGYDHCVIRLGVPGVVRAFDIDTNHFLGNHPPFASVDGACAVEGEPLEWRPLLRQSALRPGSQNLFTAQDGGLVTHVRLNIFPDGGVARFRVFGEVAPDWHAAHDALQTEHAKGLVDLAALVNGGKALACSDSFFGPMDNLLLPGRATDMGGGWETRRRRGPGHDWILVRLAAPGTPEVIEIDTAWFKGNYPDRCRVMGVHAPGADLVDLLWGAGDWREIMPETKLAADDRQFVRVKADAPITHVRLEIFPDGGISRLRVFGTAS